MRESGWAALAGGPLVAVLHSATCKRPFQGPLLTGLWGAGDGHNWVPCHLGYSKGPSLPTGLLALFNQRVALREGSRRRVEEGSQGPLSGSGHCPPWLPALLRDPAPAFSVPLAVGCLWHQEAQGRARGPGHLGLPLPFCWDETLSHLAAADLGTRRPSCLILFP